MAKGSASSPERVKEFIQAVYDNDAARVSAMLNEGVDVNASESEDFTALHYAVWLGHKSVVKALLEYNPAMEVRTVTGLTPLVLAASNSHEDIAIMLLEKGADPNFAEENGGRAIDRAAENGLIRTLKELRARGADIGPSQEGKASPIMLAAYKGRLTAVKKLVSYGSDIHYRAKDGSTALEGAMRNGHENVFDYLVQQRADVKAVGSGGFNLVMWGAIGNKPRMMKRLLKMKVPLEHLPNNSPRFIAAVMNYPDIARVALEAGGDIDKRDVQNNTAHDVAIANDNHEIAAMIDAEADRRLLKAEVREITQSVQKGVGPGLKRPKTANFKKTN